VQPAVARIVGLPHSREPHFLEGANRRDLPDVRIGDAGACRRLSEDDADDDERADHRRAEPATDRIRLPDEEVEAGSLFNRVEENRVLRVLGEEIRLDQPDRIAAADDDRVQVGGLASRDAGRSCSRPPGASRVPRRRRTCSRPSQSWTRWRSPTPSGRRSRRTSRHPKAASAWATLLEEARQLGVAATATV